MQQVQDRWNQLVPAFSELPAQLEVLGAELRSAIDNDAARWRYTLGESEQPEYLSSWLTTRIGWMTDAFAAEG